MGYPLRLLFSESGLRPYLPQSQRIPTWVRTRRSFPHSFPEQRDVLDTLVQGRWLGYQCLHALAQQEHLARSAAAIIPPSSKVVLSIRGDICRAYLSGIVTYRSAVIWSIQQKYMRCSACTLHSGSGSDLDSCILL